MPGGIHLFLWPAHKQGHLGQENRETQDWMRQVRVNTVVHRFASYAHFPLTAIALQNLQNTARFAAPPR